MSLSDETGERDPGDEREEEPDAVPRPSLEQDHSHSTTQPESSTSLNMQSTIDEEPQQEESQLEELLRSNECRLGHQNWNCPKR